MLEQKIRLLAVEKYLFESNKLLSTTEILCSLKKTMESRLIVGPYIMILKL